MPTPRESVRTAINNLQIGKFMEMVLSNRTHPTSGHALGPTTRNVKKLPHLPMCATI